MSTRLADPALQEALRLADAGETVPAFNAFVQLVDVAHPPPEAASAFGWFLARQMPPADHPTVHRALERALTRCWVRPEALVPAVIRQLTARYPRALAGEAAAGEPQLVQLLGDALLIALLGATPAATPGLELLLARFRHAVLRRVAEGQDIAPFLPTLAALAVRGAQSGYALTLPASTRHRQDMADEPALLAAVAGRLGGGVSDPGYPAFLATIACYQEPDASALGAGLAAGQPMARLIGRRIAGPRARREQHAREVAALTPIDASSGAVAAQYEAHPYPAWTCEPADPVLVPDPVLEALGGVEAVRRALVAGCGTGQHALAAARAWPHAEVLAVDLSRASLGYAIDKAREAGETRLAFGQADLLRLPERGERFEVIEAMGVLHHLADPDAGLRALAAMVVPGGVIGLAFYSAAARRGLLALRGRYGAHAADDVEVRRFRAWALAEAIDDPFLRSADFYSIGGCRDALFHARERAFDLPEIAAMLERVGLVPLALQPPPRAYDRLAELPASTDLAGWAEAEREDPDLFATMIELWVQPAGR